MAVVPVQCPQCQGIDVVKYGKQANGAQRYRCNHLDCPRHIFLLQYHDTGRLPAIKQRIVDLTLNGCGVRDIVRVLRVSSATVVNTLKKRPQVSNRSTSSCSTPSLLSQQESGSQ
jgi:insertion element IS1 protein InsB